MRLWPRTIRNGAEFAWVPHGDTCAFCTMLASRGWQRASKKALKNGHAEHIHAHCDCEYAVRFGRESSVKGYDPDEYLRRYRAAWAARKYSTNEDNIAKIKTTMAKQVLALPESSQKVLQAYTGFTATRVNFAIRNGNITPRVQETIHALDNALAPGVMPQAVTLYRNTALSFLGLNLPKNPTEHELQTIVRRQQSFPIFLSTSFKDLRLPGRDTVIQLHIPKGYNGCQFLQPVALPKFKDQDEVLFARKMVYRVLDARVKDGRYFLEIEVLPND